jgi:transcriptional regulator with XRE-family HTH domain
MYPSGYGEKVMDKIIGSAEAVGSLARAARLAQGMTRDEVANSTGFSPKFISHVEGGKPTAQIGKVLQLLAELGITLRAQTSVDIPFEIEAARRRRTRHAG